MHSSTLTLNRHAYQNYNVGAHTECGRLRRNVIKFLRSFDVHHGKIQTSGNACNSQNGPSRRVATNAAASSAGQVSAPVANSIQLKYGDRHVSVPRGQVPLRLAFWFRIQSLFMSHHFPHPPFFHPIFLTCRSH